MKTRAKRARRVMLAPGETPSCTTLGRERIDFLLGLNLLIGETKQKGIDSKNGGFLSPLRLINTEHTHTHTHTHILTTPARDLKYPTRGSCWPLRIGRVLR